MKFNDKTLIYGFLRFCKTVESVTIYGFYGSPLGDRKTVTGGFPSATQVAR